MKPLPALPSLRPTFVTLFDVRPKSSVPAFTRGARWSGWACPLLTSGAVRSLFGADSVHVDARTDTLTLMLLRGTYAETRSWLAPSPESHPLTGEPLYDFTGAGFAFEEHPCSPHCGACADVLRVRSR